jgi:hypothetical protein
LVAGMKSLLVVVGIGSFTAPAVAGNSKSDHRKASKPVAAAPVTVEAPVIVASTETPAAAPTGMLAATSTDTPAVLDIPALPADTSSALLPMPELEARAAVTKPAKLAKAINAKALSAKAPTLNLGQDYVLGGRRAASKPEREVEQIIPRSLTQAQVATVVQSHMADIQNCWDLVPKAQRVDACTAMLRLSISDAGAVTDIELGGDVPAGAQKCMTSAIARWSFPVAEQKSDVEYGVSLRSL